MLIQGLVCHLRWIFAVKRLWNFFLMRLFGRGSTRRGAHWLKNKTQKCCWRGEECSRFAVSVWQIHIKMTFRGPYKTTSTFVTSNHNNDFTYKGFFLVIGCGHSVHDTSSMISPFTTLNIKTLYPPHHRSRMITITGSLILSAALSDVRR